MYVSDNKGLNSYTYFGANFCLTTKRQKVNIVILKRKPGHSLYIKNFENFAQTIAFMYVLNNKS